MTDAAAPVFDAQAAAYDGLRRRLIPPFDRFYSCAVGALELSTGTLRRILDLGAGTGILSSLVRAEHPGAELVLLDGAPAMLERARSAVGEPVTFHVGDLRDPLPDGAFDAAISALAIHHLDDPGKRDLFERVYSALRPGGVFVNAEQVCAPSDELERSYRAWHRERSLGLGATPEQWAAATERMRLDRCATVGEQSRWLSDTGFVDVDCLFKEYRFAVLVARRPASR